MAVAIKGGVRDRVLGANGGGGTYPAFDNPGGGFIFHATGIGVGNQLLPLRSLA